MSMAILRTSLKTGGTNSQRSLLVKEFRKSHTNILALFPDTFMGRPNKSIISMTWRSDQGLVTILGISASSHRTHVVRSCGPLLHTSHVVCTSVWHTGELFKTAEPILNPFGDQLAWVREPCIRLDLRSSTGKVLLKEICADLNILTWRIRWIDLCGGGDAGCRYYYCNKLSKFFHWLVPRVAVCVVHVTSTALLHYLVKFANSK